ncbi:hypothetical protein FA13DRAFT_1723890 [Coprinellus micaceus]|uniref:Uncharacterized protein n=1 Tax=Coprinellus micaceus TaxID=71717 RepID=A0A4Y7TZS1_COPMI|nr:hypothetical protein FA13DRAFT_1723890 [Coprinellus micaceus]
MGDVVFVVQMLVLIVLVMKVGGAVVVVNTSVSTVRVPTISSSVLVNVGSVTHWPVAISPS